MKERGFLTWFDEEKMEGQIRQAMTKALAHTACVIVCVTKIYESKINSANENDNCYYEFHYASNHSRLCNARIAIATEKGMSNPKIWDEDGRLFAELGGKLIIDLSENENEKNFNKQIDELAKALNAMILLKK